MPVSAFTRGGFAALVLVMATQASRAEDVAPVNSGANPYKVIRDWAKLTREERPSGGSNGVAIDRDGKTVWATDRCSAAPAPGCLGSRANPVHHFGVDGNEIRWFPSWLRVNLSVDSQRERLAMPRTGAGACLSRPARGTG